MELKARRMLGAHYTTEENILKALGPLFLDELWAEFEKLKRDKKRLKLFHNKLGKICILDPACGCGNFLVLAYRELRLLELSVLRELYEKNLFLDLKLLTYIDVDQFYGIEIEEFPAQISCVALWLTDHQMNLIASKEFGGHFTRLPLSKAPQICHGNALTLDWRSILDPMKCSYIVGNPPFIGGQFLNKVQREEVKGVFKEKSACLDYVASWYYKASEYMLANKAIRSAFVSTSSITQGEQVSALWTPLLELGVKIFFAHRTFQWTSEARDMAAVHCVIIGFSLHEISPKKIFEYESLKGSPHSVSAKHINPYLLEGPDIIVKSRSVSLCDVPKIGIGNQPIDNGNYLFSDDERVKFLEKEPQAEKWFRPWVGAYEFLNNHSRLCLWLRDCPPEQLRNMPESCKRVDAVRIFRQKSKRTATQKLAKTPRHFDRENIPEVEFLLIPKTSSAKRHYIPLGFMTPETLCSDAVLIVQNATIYHFGILSSLMHMAWVRVVGGRLKSDYRYSCNIVYNNFPWPPDIHEHQKNIENAARTILETRNNYPQATLADLYDPITIPPDLLKAHLSLDRQVDKAYSRKSFSNEFERISFLFQRYQNLVAEKENKV